MISLRLFRVIFFCSLPTPMNRAVAFQAPTNSSGCTVGSFTTHSGFTALLIKEPSLKLLVDIILIMRCFQPLLPILKHFKAICHNIFEVSFPKQFLSYFNLLHGVLLYGFFEDVAIGKHFFSNLG